MKIETLVFITIAAIVWVYFFHRAKSKWDFFIGAMIGALTLAIIVLGMTGGW